MKEVQGLLAMTVEMFRRNTDYALQWRRVARVERPILPFHDLIRNGIGLNADRQDKSVKHGAWQRSDLAESIDIVLSHTCAECRRWCRAPMSLESPGRCSFRERTS
jgi:hypothetical protein